MRVSESPGQRREPINKTQKRTQHCTICKNHDTIAPKKGHNCPFLECTCRLCTLTRKSQMAMRHQQRVWRHQKQKLKSLTFDDETVAPVSNSENRSNKSQACDKCRNHNKLKLKKNHQCPFQECGCPFCSLTFKRRELMKHQQRVRRSRITSEMEIESCATPNSAEAKESENEYLHCRQEADETEKYDKGAPIYPNTSDNRPIQELENPSNNTENRMPPVPLDTLSVKYSSSSLETKSPQQTPSDVHSTIDIQTESDERLRRESPPPLINVRSYRPSSSQPYHRNSRSVSPRTPLNYSIQPDDSPTFSCQLQRFSEEPKEDVHRAHPRVITNDTNSLPSATSFPPQPSQHLQSISTHLATQREIPMDPIKFETQFQDLNIQNYNWNSAPLIGSSLENISPRAPLLRPQQERPSIQLLHPHPEIQRPIRPLPLNVSHSHRNSGPFSEQMWNRMVLSLNFGFHQQNSRARLGGFHSTLQSPGFNSRNVFHTA